MDIQKVISQMTLEEKASVCSGLDFWRTQPVGRLGVESVMCSDGPHGLRKQGGKTDNLGINSSKTAVCFPAACATASSFDRKLMREFGETLGRECQAEEIAYILGPAVNIKRSPLGGRNFEYISEDPYLAGELSAAYINGVQSQNIGTSLKHFALNNQEHERMAGSSEADERTMREIYLPAFETAIKQAQPWTVMSCYNRANGQYVGENPWFLTELLRDEWGFEGYVVSDWGAVSDRVKGLKAGLDLEMPGTNGVSDAEIVKAVREGRLDEKVVDTAVARILRINQKYLDNRQKVEIDWEEEHQKAIDMARQCMVLLKNDNNVLPLPEQEEGIAFIGGFCKNPRYQGGGSSHINAYRVDSTLERSADYGAFAYAEGFSHTDSDENANPGLLAEAVSAAKAAKKVVIFAGLPDVLESEGYDREHMRLPGCQNEVIREVCKVNRNVIVVLHNGSPIEMPWIDDVSAVLYAFLGGEGVAIALLDTLFGRVSPGGKLTETFPLRVQDTPCYLYFPGLGQETYYDEGVFVGYRYYDSKEMSVLFPFGFGLSYTTFEISNMKVSATSFMDTDRVTVSVDVKNTGKMAGREVVQLYVSDKTQTVVRPAKELKGFEAVILQPGERKTVTMELDKRSFAWYNTKLNDWYAASGTYTLLVGNSSRNILLTQDVQLVSTTKIAFTVTRDTMFGQLFALGIPAVNDYMRAKMPALAQYAETTEKKVGGIGMDFSRMIGYIPLRSISVYSGIDTGALKTVIRELNELINNAL